MVTGNNLESIILGWIERGEDGKENGGEERRKGKWKLGREEGKKEGGVERKRRMGKEEGEGRIGNANLL